MSLAPALFISHGAPTLAIEPSRLGPALLRVGQGLPAKGEGMGVRAVLVVSAPSGADVTVIDGGVDNGVLSMESYGWGLPGGR